MLAPLAARHVSQTTVASSLFLGLLYYYTNDIINRIKIKSLSNALNVLLILGVGTFLFNYTAFAKRAPSQFIKNESAYAPYQQQFAEEFKRIEIINNKRQIY